MLHGAGSGPDTPPPDPRGCGRAASSGSGGAMSGVFRCVNSFCCILTCSMETLSLSSSLVSLLSSILSFSILVPRVWMSSSIPARLCSSARSSVRTESLILRSSSILCRISGPDRWSQSTSPSTRRAVSALSMVSLLVTATTGSIHMTTRGITSRHGTRIRSRVRIRSCLSQDQKVSCSRRFIFLCHKYMNCSDILLSLDCKIVCVSGVR